MRRKTENRSDKAGLKMHSKGKSFCARLHYGDFLKCKVRFNRQSIIKCCITKTRLFGFHFVSYSSFILNVTLRTNYLCKTENLEKLEKSMAAAPSLLQFITQKFMLILRDKFWCTANVWFHQQVAWGIAKKVNSDTPYVANNWLKDKSRNTLK